MREGIRKEAKKKLQQIKENQVFIQYLWCIGISLLLGIALEFKLLDKLSNEPVQLINQFVNTSNSSPIEHSLIFSTSAAILATIFTIIFVILTLFIQVSDVSASTDIFRSKETRYLVILYFSTIILSLMMLETMHQFPILVLTMTFACILSLYPFLRNISDKLTYNVGIVKIYSELSLQINSKNEPSTRVKVMSLSKTCERSMKDNKWVAFIEIMGILDEITKMAKENQMTQVIRIIGISYSNFLDILIKDMATNSNRDSMFIVMEENILTYVSDYSINVESMHLKTILIATPLRKLLESIKDGFKTDFFNEQIVILCIKLFSKLGDRDTEDYQMDKWIIDSLGELAKESYNYKLERSLNKSIGALFAIGVKAYVNKKPVYSVSLVINELENIEKHIQYENLRKAYDSFNDVSHISWAFGEPQLEPYFDEFKELYDKSKQK